MKVSLIGFISILIFSTVGCSYPELQVKELNELVFENKRLEKKPRNIKEFIRPKETADVLVSLTLQDFSSKQKET